jgi:hypothetical protein
LEASNSPGVHFGDDAAARTPALRVNEHSRAVAKLH